MLQMTRERLASYKETSIPSLLDLVHPVLDYRHKLHRRLTRKTGRFQLMGDAPQNKTIVPFESYIVSIAQGYLGGKEPLFIVREGKDATAQEREKAVEYKKALEDICRYNDCQATHLDLVGDFLELAAAYLYIYEDKQNRIVHARLDPLQTVGIWDYGTPANLIGVVRTWMERDESDNRIHVVETITEQARTRYTQKGNGFVVTDQEKLVWGNDVPVVAFEKEGMTAVFEPALTLIDAYEQISNNITSMTRYNDEAKLKISGYTAAHQYGISPEEDEARRKEEALFMAAQTLFVGADGDISWLLKNVDYSGLLAVQKSLQNTIMLCVASPDTTDATFTAAESSLALRLKMFPFELRVALIKAIFRKGYLRMVELETNRLNLKGKDYDFTAVDVEVPVNVPSDMEKSVATANAMYAGGLFSQKTCIQKSGVDVDPDAEIARLFAEQEAAYATGMGTDPPIEADGRSGEDVTP